jgi:membrane-associated phospholipid phosphatase
MHIVCRLFVVLLMLPVVAFARQTDTTANTLQHVELAADTIQSEKNKGGTGNDSTLIKLDLKTYSVLLADNLKRQALFPAYLKGKDWLKVGGFALVSGAIAFANEPVKQYAIKLHDRNKEVAFASKHITRFGMQYANYSLAGFLAYSHIFKNQKLKNTTLLATQAYIISNLVGGAAKLLFSVQGPFYTDPLTHKMGPIFHGPFYTLKKDPNGQKLKSTNYVSFPSGHTFSAFAIATVFAMEYKDKPFIPILGYSAATLVGLSRLTENRHWAMDILPGALLGYYSAKQVVNNYRRKSKNKARAGGRGVSFNVQYVHNQLIPGMIYQF